MNDESETQAKGAGKARWIGFGFVAAFAASVLTVIYTGLMVEGSPAEFDTGFRSVTMTVGESRSIELIFHAPDPVSDARLVVDLPAVLDLAGGADAGTMEKPVRLDPGRNVFTIDVRGRAPGSDYLVGRVFGDEPIALERVFVTVLAPDSL